MTANGPAVRPRLGALARLWVAQRRRSTLGWTLGVVAMTTVTAAMYPTIQNRPEFQDLLDKYPAELLAFFGGSGLDITSPSGYLTIELFSAMAPVLFVAMGIAGGAAASGGLEEPGRMALFVSLPIRRRRIGAELAAGVAIPIVTVAAAWFITLWACGPLFDLHLSVAKLAAGVLDVTVLALVVGLTAFAIGLATGKRSAAIGASTTLAVVSYLADSLAGLVPWLRAARRISVFSLTLADRPLVNGFHVGDTAALAAATVAIVLVGLALFERRDLRG